MLTGLIQKARRAARKPPAYVARRIMDEISASSERWRAPWRARRVTGRWLCAQFGSPSIEELWNRLLAQQTLAAAPIDRPAYERLCPGDAQRILALAENAIANRVQFLGSPLQELSSPVEWHTDFKVGKTWTPAFFRDIEYANLDQPSDVKIPWELSRLQWLVPLGQAFVLAADERYARAARRLIADWISANPYAYSVNWACTMEAAMRVMTLTWLFGVFGRSSSWHEDGFREAFLAALWLHVDFAQRFIERADINGNHFTADAAALVVGGQLFHESEQGRRWRDSGLEELEREMPLQVFADGVDYEASVPYHRLVLELFFVAAFSQRNSPGSLSAAYMQRLAAMARFVAAYSRTDGSSPLWGDADDARVLPFGGQALGDHRYLIGLVGLLSENADITALHSGPLSEACWWFGAAGAQRLAAVPLQLPGTQAFDDAGVYIMRGGGDHIFIDCGPVGLAGRGGHGHNDALSFEAMLAGVLLVSDSGAFVYTADPAARNRFRGTRMHNTPSVDGTEINSFIAPDNLWQLADEARPEVIEWSPGPVFDAWSGRHCGYRKLQDPVDVRRRIVLEHSSHALTITDTLEGPGRHEIVIPLQLAPGVEFHATSSTAGLLQFHSTRFRVTWCSDVPWTLVPTRSVISPSYGVSVDINRLEWRRRGLLPCSLTVQISQDARVDAWN
jgi:Heparinase II/III-like protein/Heparinase II/III N-terminus